MGGDRAVDLLQQRDAHRAGRDEHLALALGVPVAGQRVEQVRDLLAELAVGREQAEVLVQAGGLGVEVAGADHHVVAHPVALAADDQNRLRVRLEAGDPVHNMRADLLERP